MHSPRRMLRCRECAAQYELNQLKRHRPDMNGIDDLDKELELEYHNAMLFASDKVLRRLAALLQDKSLTNYEAVAKAMREDLFCSIK